MTQKTKKTYERKVNALVSNFLDAKQAAGEAHEKAAALDKRLENFRKERDAGLEERRVALEKKQLKRQDAAAKAEEAELAHAGALREELEIKMEGAQKRRAEMYSTDRISNTGDKQRAKYQAVQRAGEQMG